MELKWILMNAADIRLEINQYLELVKDERFLKVVHSMLNTYIQENVEDPIIGYDIEGAPVRASEARKQFAEDLQKRDEFMSLEDFEEELEALWKNIKFSLPEEPRTVLRELSVS